MEEVWAYGTGKTWKSLNDFPARLRRMAEEVKQVQAGLHFGPDSMINGESHLAKDIKRRIRELPLDLAARGRIAPSGVAKFVSEIAAIPTPAGSE
jgi:hypothetical protein